MGTLSSNSREFNAAEISAEVGVSIEASLLEAADSTVAEIKQSLSTPYPPASSPGSYPHYRTKTLYDSIKHEGVKNHMVDLYSDDPKASHLEFGTSKMAARPFWEPAMQRLESRIDGIYLKHLKQ